MSWERSGDSGEPSPGLGLPGGGSGGGGWASPGLVASPLTPPILHGYSGSGRDDSRGGVNSVRSRSPEKADKDRDRRKKAYGDLNGGHNHNHPQHVTWDRAKASSARVNGYPSYQSQNQGFFARHMRRLSSVGLPSFAYGAQEEERLYGEKEKLGRGRIAWSSWTWKGVATSVAEVRHWSLEDWRNLLRWTWREVVRWRRQILVLLLCVLIVVLYNIPAVYRAYRRHPYLGNGKNFVLILGANQGGGVMEWKGPREWAIERDSVRNKKKYAAEWGYELEIVDLATKKRYAHEWRESWEKVDIVRNAMKKYPHAEWFWWLDLNSFIMEHTVSLQTHIFNDLSKTTYRDINLYNPLNISHPPNPASVDAAGNVYKNYLDPTSLSPVGDGDPNSINIIVPQDCGGFNLGSFFVRRSAWTDRLLDVWWDPVFYEQRHMEWEHKEQDALEYIYTNQPWIRPHLAFIAQRRVNAFPTGACGDDRGLPPPGTGSPLSKGGCRSLNEDEKEDKQFECGLQGIHYQEKERDFLVNMAGCEWGRDCWGEMYNFRQLSNHLNRNRWEKFKDWVSDAVKGIRDR